MTTEIKSETAIKSAARTSGIDALKLLAMQMVVILHVLGFGGVLDACPVNSPGYNAAWLLESGAFCAVNIFSMTSGFLLCERGFKSARILKIQLQAVFYALAINILYAALLPGSVGLGDFVKAVFPVTSGLWWYLSVYFGLSVLMPFVNRLLAALDLRQTGILIAAIVCMGMMSRLFEAFAFNGGYSVIWLVFMYIIGASIKRFDLGAKIKKRVLALICVGAWLAAWGSRYVMRLASTALLGTEFGVNMLVDYQSPLMIVMAASLLILFRRLELAKPIAVCVKYLAPLSFAVYLIHEHPLVRYTFISGRFAYLAERGVPELVLTVFVAAVVIFAACLAIEFVRTSVFRLARLDKLIEKLGTKLDSALKLGL